MSASATGDQVAKNKALYRRVLEEGFNQGRLEVIDEIASKSYVLHDAPPGTPAGPDAIKQVITMFRKGFPDLHIEIEEMVGEGDHVCVRATTRGTHKGVIFDLQPTGNTVAMPGLTMVTIRDGKLIESWVRSDIAGLMRQLGAGPK